MSPHEPDPSDADWVKRYRQASDADAALPSPATREAILAEGRRIAAQRAANSTTHMFDPKQPAANQSRWKLAAVGTVGAALFAAVLMFPHFGSPPHPTSAEKAPAAPRVSAVTSEPAAAAAPALTSTPSVAAAPANQPALSKSPNDALEEIALTGARQAPPPPAQNLARYTESAPSRVAGPSRDAAPSRDGAVSSDGAVLDRNADSGRRESEDIGVSAQARALAAPAAKSAPAASSLMGGAATPSSLTENALLSSVASGDLARVAALLDHDASPDPVDSLGRTPLLLAVIAHREDMVQLLLAHQANPNAADHAGQTPLQRARSDDLPNIVHLLERAGAR